MEPALAEELANARPAHAGDGSQPSLETARSRARLFLTEVDRYLAGGSVESVDAKRHDAALELFGKRLRAAMQLDMTYRTEGTLWPLAANGMPLLDGANRAKALALASKSAWTAVLGWCALEAIGGMHDPENPDLATTELFDALRLRGPLAAAFAAQNLVGDEEWRAAARPRAAVVHPTPPRGPAGALLPPHPWILRPHPPL